MDNLRQITSAPKTEKQSTPIPGGVSGVLIDMKARKDEIMKKREEEFREKVEKNVAKFMEGVEQYFSIGVSSLKYEENTDFYICSEFIGELLSDMENNKEHYLSIFNSDFSRLDVEERFYHTFIQFLYNYKETLVLRNLKRCVRELIQVNPDVPLYKMLRKYLYYILEAIIYLKKNDKIGFNLKYLGDDTNKLIS